MGWPIIKWAACFKMGQIINQAVTYISILKKPYIKGKYWIITTISLDDNYI